MRTQLLLVAAMALVIIVATSVSMLLVRHRLKVQVSADLAHDLEQSVITFRDLQTLSLRSLDRENALLADLPSLKALMTSGDVATMRDGGAEFWQTGGEDLFALADPRGRVVAAYTQDDGETRSLDQELETLLVSQEKHFLVHGRSLYACSVRPVFFAGDATGTLLGYVISGASLGRNIRQMSNPTAVEASFVSQGQVVASTLDFALRQKLLASLTGLASLTNRAKASPAAEAVQLGETRYLAAREDLSSSATSPLQLVVLKSLQPAEKWIARIDRLVLTAGLVALLLGTTLMIAFSRLLTHPLEELSAGVRAFGSGDGEHRLPERGPQEIRQLSLYFAGMRAEIQRANRALIETERLATIGRMASSVSHDLRHYLAAVYANAEFLTADGLSPGERTDIFAEIRAAVDGTTEMIDSLLIFSRTGHVHRSPELLALLLDRAIALVRAHPDTQGIAITTICQQPTQTAVLVDGKQVQRAIYNLILNACQSIRSSPSPRAGEISSPDAGRITAALELRGEHIALYVIDNGIGVPESIRGSLFEPFVSEGKQKGSGLGLTLAHTIAKEYGGDLTLQSSRPGQTIFRMTLPRTMHPADLTAFKADCAPAEISLVSTGSSAEARRPDRLTKVNQSRGL